MSQLKPNTLRVTNQHPYIDPMNLVDKYRNGDEVAQQGKSIYDLAGSHLLNQPSFSDIEMMIERDKMREQNLGYFYNAKNPLFKQKTLEQVSHEYFSTFTRQQEKQKELEYRYWGLNSDEIRDVKMMERDAELRKIATQTMTEDERKDMRRWASNLPFVIEDNMTYNEAKREDDAIKARADAFRNTDMITSLSARITELNGADRRMFEQKLNEIVRVIKPTEAPNFRELVDIIDKRMIDKQTLEETLSKFAMLQLGLLKNLLDQRTDEEEEEEVEDTGKEVEGEDEDGTTFIARFYDIPVSDMSEQNKVIYDNIYRIFRENLKSVRYDATKKQLTYVDKSGIAITKSIGDKFQTVTMIDNKLSGTQDTVRNYFEKLRLMLPADKVGRDGRTYNKLFAEMLK